MQKGRYNVVVFHLESINQMALKHHLEQFPNLLKIMDSCVQWINYHSTATSTYMVMADITYEDSECYEQSKELENIFSIKNNAESVWDTFCQWGYRTKVFVNGYGAEDPVENIFHFLTRQGEHTFLDSSETFMSEFSELVCNSEKFATYILEKAGHITYNGKRMADKEGLCAGYLNRYKVLDEMIGNLLFVLKKEDKVKDTILIFYGDHGDSFWGHGLHGGYMHAIPPYSDLIKCPLICYFPWEDGRVEERLICTKDIRRLLLTWSQGVTGLEQIDRRYVFSRNLYVNQPLSKNIFEKGYSVSNLQYTLVVTRKGLEMYLNSIDVFNQINILEFFDLKRKRINYRNIFSNIHSGHYKAVMTEKNINGITEQFEELCDILSEEIRNIYKASDRTCREMRMNKINYCTIKFPDKIVLYSNMLLLFMINTYGWIQRKRKSVKKRK